ncbi:hypothetical protein [Mucilaginibacter pedocola]|uniref:Uncharacterized protein n=1 Tax=Mucilaginibacter pedocola TaxID=1792845 RepID=A0A1S9P6X2_9SPHI|nr:hypothetical protein [Mucilaginibacter pedocola]OOQ56701.1 hypothetical protein BC343_17035 [Mucilaginibacter pedocola]
MMQLTFSFTTALMLICYCYLLVNAHILLARVDRNIRVPRKPNGAILLKDLRVWSATRFNNTQPEVNRSILFFRLSNYISVLFIAMLAFSAIHKIQRNKQQQIIIINKTT